MTLEESDDDVLTPLHVHSVTYRIATDPHRGRKVFTLQTLPNCEGGEQAYGQAANVAEFSLHAGAIVEAQQRNKLERLCR